MKIETCAICQSTIPLDEASFCDICGYRFPQSVSTSSIPVKQWGAILSLPDEENNKEILLVKCKKCDHQNSSKHTFCDRCGQLLH